MFKDSRVTDSRVREDLRKSLDTAADLERTPGRRASRRSDDAWPLDRTQNLTRLPEATPRDPYVLTYAVFRLARERL